MTLDPDERKTLIDHRLTRADETLAEAVLLKENRKYAAAVSRAYYCMFYALSALAVSEGYKTGKHAQLIGWFNKTWVRTGKINSRYSKMIYRAFDKRMLGDYSDLPSFSESEVDNLIAEGAEFIEMLKNLLKSDTSLS